MMVRSRGASIFGLDSSRGQPAQGPGFGATPDAFASISQHRGTGHDDDDQGYVHYAMVDIAVWLTNTELISMIHTMDLAIN